MAQSCCCFSCINAGSVGVVQCFGKFQKVQQPGAGIVCFPFQTIFSTSLAVQQITCDSDCKTKDNVTLRVVTAVQFRIDMTKVKEAMFDIKDPKLQMAAHVDNVLRSTLPNLDLDEAYCAKEKMVKGILGSVKEAMSPYGYEILDVLITDLRPEQSVLRAMNEINAAKRMREAAIEKGEAEKTLKVKAAEADARAKELSGKGIANMRQAITEGFQESVKSMQECGLGTQDTIVMMMVTQYLDTLKEFKDGKASIMVPHGAGGMKNLESQVRDGFITASSLG